MNVELLNEAGGVSFNELDIEDMERAAKSFRQVEYLENAEGAFFKSAEVVKSLKKITNLSASLESELRRDDPDGYAAADMSGGIYHLEAISSIHARAQKALEEGEQVAKSEQGQQSPETTRARKQLAQVAARCWQEAGGQGSGRSISSEGRPGPLIRVILCLLDEMPNPPGSRTLQEDLKALPSYQDAAEVKFSGLIAPND